MLAVPCVFRHRGGEAVEHVGCWANPSNSIEPVARVQLKRSIPHTYVHSCAANGSGQGQGCHKNKEKKQKQKQTNTNTSKNKQKQTKTNKQKQTNKPKHKQKQCDPSISVKYLGIFAKMLHAASNPTKEHHGGCCLSILCNCVRTQSSGAHNK